MSAFKSWLTQSLDLGQEPDLEDAFEAGRRSVLGHRDHTSVGVIFSRLDREVVEHKIRLAGALALLHEQGAISRSKMLQLSDMTGAEIAKALATIGPRSPMRCNKMKEIEMFERKVWLTVYVKTIESVSQSKTPSHKECSDRAEIAVQAYRKMFGDSRFTGEERN